ncbi:MAG: protein kinase [Acidobacteria bacterium]|nr:protein kinase [Acidobacteriota bacterium]
MPLRPHERLGPYEILAPLGRGGMGEVWRARDTTLDREVAIKTLAPELAAHPDLLSRQRREARLLAALNHPNVGAIHGLLEQDGAVYLVLEFVPGETLADRLARGALPLDEALAVGEQVAAALEAAHEAGIVHRDLKPANVKIRPDGAVKVLDLGIARGLEPETAGRAAGGDGTHTPTSTHRAPTGTGVVIGSAGYMSPEQARGLAIDRRTDLFSFGCLLFECLSGQRAFPGETPSDALAAVLRGEPDWDALPEGTPSRLVALLRRCLAKDPRRRLRDAGDLRLELEELRTAGPTAEPPAAQLAPAPAAPAAAAGTPRREGRPAGWPRWMALPLMGGLAIAAVAILGPRWRAPGAAPAAATAPVVRATLDAGPGIEPVFGDRVFLANRISLAISPDGRTVVFVGRKDGAPPQLFRRALDAGEAEPIPETEGADGPFYSPDGQWIGFFSGFELKKIPAAGGAPAFVARVPPVSAGADWGAGGAIVYARTFNGALWRVRDTGGVPEQITQLDASRAERAHLWPQLLPDGRILLAIVRGRDFQDIEGSEVAVIDPASGARTVLLEAATFARVVGDRIVFARGTQVFASRFDARALRVDGAAQPLGLPIAMAADVGVPQLAVSGSGTLVFVDGPAQRMTRSALVALDRAGREKAVLLAQGTFSNPALSPDGQRVALQACEGFSCKLFALDPGRGVLAPVARDPGRFFGPAWSPDGRRLAFSRLFETNPKLGMKAADGSGEITALTEGNQQDPEFSGSWSPDGRVLLYSRGFIDPVHAAKIGARDLWLLEFDAAGKASERPWFESEATETTPFFSPDGRFVVYVSSESGRPEVFLRPFPGPGERVQISRDGGLEPAWSRGGREIVFRNGRGFYAVAFDPAAPAAVSAPRLLFEADLVPGGREDFPLNYAVTPDGETFLALRPLPEPRDPRRLGVVTGWTALTGP